MGDELQVEDKGAQCLAHPHLSGKFEWGGFGPKKATFLLQIRPVILKIEHASEPPGILVKIQVSAPSPVFLMYMSSMEPEHLHFLHVPR